jgi:hypothetical protein
MKIVIDIGDSRMGPDNQREVIRRMDGDGLDLVGVNGWHVGCRVTSRWLSGGDEQPYTVEPLDEVRL